MFSVILLTLLAVPSDKPAQNFGVDVGRLRATNGYEINGQSVTRQQVIEAITFGFADDSHKGHITVVSADPVFRKGCVAATDNDAALAEFKGKFRVQAYEPTNWALRPFKLDIDDGFKQHGSAIYVQGPANGQGKAKVVRALYGKLDVASLAGALREADPHYQPNKPTPPAPGPVPVPRPEPGPGNSQWFPLIGLGLAVLFLILGRGK